MGRMKIIWGEIIERYPDDILLQTEIIQDFQNWKDGYYGLPRTKELREILEDLSEGRI